MYSGNVLCSVMNHCLYTCRSELSSFIDIKDVKHPPIYIITSVEALCTMPSLTDLTLSGHLFHEKFFSYAECKGIDFTGMYLCLYSISLAMINPCTHIAVEMSLRSFDILAIVTQISICLMFCIV